VIWFFGLGSDGKANCPDGSTKYVERKLEKLPIVFGQYFPELELKVKGGANASQEIASANGETSYGKKAHVIHEGYDTIAQWAYHRFVAAYYVYKADPCKYDDYLKKEVEKINDRLDAAALSETDKKVQFLKTAASPDPAAAASSDPRLGLADDVEKMLDSMIDRLAN
jgi:hypothetical protein